MTAANHATAHPGDIAAARGCPFDATAVRARIMARQRASERKAMERARQREGLMCLPAQWMEAEAVEALWALADYFDGDQAKAFAWAIETSLENIRARKIPRPIPRPVARDIAKGPTVLESQS